MMTAQYQAALHSYAEGRYEEAMQQFSELLYEDPRNPKLHIWLGATFRKAGKIEYAKVQYQQVLSLTNDPDLLDLASTSLAQIQNKLANAAKRINTSPDLSNPSKEVEETNSSNHKTSNNQPLQLEVTQNFSLGANNLFDSAGYTASHSSNYIIDPDGDENIENLTLLAPPSITSLAKNGSAVKVPSNGNGAVPPPPAIAALFTSSHQGQEEDPRSSQSDVSGNHPVNHIGHDNVAADIPHQNDVSVLNNTIADLQKANKKTKKAPKKNQKKDHVEFPPVESIIFAENTEDHAIPIAIDRSPVNAPIALEDMFKFSSVGQKITLWGALVATIPAIVLGLTAYQVGDGLLLTKSKQVQQAEAIALAQKAESFLRQKTDDVEVLRTLLVSTEVGQNTLQTSGQSSGQISGQNTATTNPSENSKANKPMATWSIAQQRQYKQQLTSRLNLYSQAYPKYSSIALFSISGELLAQSNNTKTQQMQILNPDTLNKVIGVENILIGSPIAKKDETYLYATTAVKSSVSQKVSMVLQVEIPLKSLVNDLNTHTSDSNFYLIDSANKYVASSQTVAIGEDASADFAMLSNFRSANPPSLPETLKGDRNVLILAYASVPNMQKYGMLPWDVLTTVDKAAVISGNQNLLLVVGIGIAATPLLVAVSIYALSRKLSTRLKDIRLALQDLRRGKTDSFLGTLSVEANDELSDISLSINKMSEQFQIMKQKQEQEKERLQMQVVKLFKVLSTLARESRQEVQDADLSDEKILQLGKKVRAEMVQRNVEVESYRKQKEDIQMQLRQMLKDMQALADGDLTISTKTIDGDLSEVGIFFDDVMRGLQNIVGQVKSSANQVNFSLGQNEQAIANLKSISQRQVDIVERSLNTAQISNVSNTSIVNNSLQVIQTSQLVTEKIADGDRAIDAVMEKVEELQSTVKTTAKRMKHLGESSQKIAKAISTINEIAIKTNFLAINATLEASRTGGGGNGFVMVAEEVGELAARSVTVTREVEVLLGSIQNETNAVMAVVESGANQVGESNTLAIAAKDNLQQIAQISQQIHELMSSISDATLSQVQTSEGIANLMKDIAHIANRTLASSSEASKFLQATRRHSGDLQQSLTYFKTR